MCLTAAPPLPQRAAATWRLAGDGLALPSPTRPCQLQCWLTTCGCGARPLPAVRAPAPAPKTATAAAAAGAAPASSGTLCLPPDSCAPAAWSCDASLFCKRCSLEPGRKGWASLHVAIAATAGVWPCVAWRAIRARMPPASVVSLCPGSAFCARGARLLSACCEAVGTVVSPHLAVAVRGARSVQGLLDPSIGAGSPCAAPPRAAPNAARPCKPPP